MEDYALEFRTLKAESKWNDPALTSAFCHGLRTEILHELACRDDKATLDSLIDMAVRTNNQL